MREVHRLEDLGADGVRELVALAGPPPRAARTGRGARGKVLALLFLNPSLRTQASFQAGMARLGGGSFVIAPDRFIHKLEFDPDAVMDGETAENIAEAAPVLASYGDALGVRAFAAQRDLAEDLADARFELIRGLCGKPFLNLESAARHPCQSLADWRTLDDLGIPAAGRPPRALLDPAPASPAPRGGLRHPADGGDARHGGDRAARPEGYELPESVMAQAGRLAAASGGSVRESDDPAGAMEGAHALYAKSWASTRHYGDPEADLALRAGLSGWTVDEGWFAGARRRRPVPPTAWPVRRGVVVAGAVARRAAERRGRAGREPHVDADGGAPPDAVMSGLERRSPDRQRRPAGLRKDNQTRVRALRHAAPYLKRFGGKTFVIKTGDAAVAAEASIREASWSRWRSSSSSASGWCSSTGAARSPPSCPKSSGSAPASSGGAGSPTRRALRVTTMVLNGEINTRILAACRDFDLPAIGLSGVDAGLIRAHRRPPVKVKEGTAEETVDYGYVGDIDGVDGGLLERLLGIGALPVVSPISADEAGTLLNINADTVASALAVALGAEKLILLGEAPGLLADPEGPGQRGLLRGPGRTGGAARARAPSAPACSPRPSASARRSKPG